METDTYDVQFTDALLFGEKVCPSCLKRWPRCKPYWHVDTDNPDGFHDVCAVCRSERYADRRREGAVT